VNLREAEARIAELELGLEKVLELFEPTEDSYQIEVLVSNGGIEGNDDYGETLIFLDLDKTSADVIESAEDLLWGGQADAEEA